MQISKSKAPGRARIRSNKEANKDNSRVLTRRTFTVSGITIRTHLENLKLV